MFSLPASIAKAVTGSCDELECFHGAKCKEKHGEVQCVCEFKCTREDRDAKTPEDHTVCGTDGNSYGSECQLRQFSCRYQKRIEVAGEGPCSKCRHAIYWIFLNIRYGFVIFIYICDGFFLNSWTVFLKIAVGTVS